jgi:hypothetical protein
MKRFLTTKNCLLKFNPNPPSKSVYNSQFFDVKLLLVVKK